MIPFKNIYDMNWERPGELVRNDSVVQLSASKQSIAVEVKSCISLNHSKHWYVFILLPWLLASSLLYVHWFFTLLLLPSPPLHPRCFPPLFGSLHLLSCCSVFHVSLLSLWQRQKLHFSSSATQGRRPLSAVELPETICGWMLQWAQPVTVELQ